MEVLRKNLRTGPSVTPESEVEDEEDYEDEELEDDDDGKDEDENVIESKLTFFTQFALLHLLQEVFTTVCLRIWT